MFGPSFDLGVQLSPPTTSAATFPYLKYLVSEDPVNHQPFGHSEARSAPAHERSGNAFVSGDDFYESSLLDTLLEKAMDERGDGIK
jgi:hypothetical protein